MTGIWSAGSQVWSIFRLLIIGGGISPILYANASSFDLGEVLSILGTMGIAGSSEVLLRMALKTDNPNHPAWSIIRLGLLGVFIWPILYANASNFDLGEVRTIVVTLILASVGEVGVNLVSRLVKKYQDDGEKNGSANRTTKEKEG
jgi:hypothetical protein